MKLFCLPYAGGSAMVYNEWAKFFDDTIKVYPVELSGRGRRYTEPLFDNIEEAVEDIYDHIKDQLDDDYAFFGHSMGALLAYELTYKVMQENKKGPKHLFLSGCQSPDTPRRRAIRYNLPTIEFIENLRSMGGTPEEVLKNNDLLAICLPILRSDFKVVETYQYVEKSNKLDCDLSVLYGTDDKIMVSDLRPWAEKTSKSCKLYEYEGDHFFIHPHRDEIINLINETVKKMK